VLADATGATILVDEVISAPFDEVWAVASDLEHELPHLVADVRSFRVVGRSGERLVAHARSRLGLPARFDVVLRPGWCLMQSRFVFGAMAATPAPGGTRFVFAGAFRNRGHRLTTWALAPLWRRVGDRIATRVAERVALNRP
jgi:hypothetical protein